MIKLPNHTSYVHHQDNWHGRPMKWLTNLTGIICWRACWPYLTEFSGRCPPTHCQILFLFGAFKSFMGQHRENSDIKHIKNTISGKAKKSEEYPSGVRENAQVVGSNVIVLTAEKNLKFKFKYPAPGNMKRTKKT